MVYDEEIVLQRVAYAWATTNYAYYAKMMQNNTREVFHAVNKYQII